MEGKCEGEERKLIFTSTNEFNEINTDFLWRLEIKKKKKLPLTVRTCGYLSLFLLIRAATKKTSENHFDEILAGWFQLMKYANLLLFFNM